MRIILALVLTVFMVSAFDTRADSHKGGDGIVDGMVDKATRGLVNTVTGIVELPRQICKGYQNGCGFIDNEVGSKSVGTILGVLRGVTHAAGRTGHGMFELAGFWTANPADNDGVGVPLDAEYAWEDGEQYSIFEPSLGEGVKPYGAKLVRGVGNAVGGILEVPGHIKKGAEDGNVIVSAPVEGT